eukprot:CAMPEP_0185805624 /NCGR_PEP_ID=MMETSP1322-20130828/3972_1 /TAXON_ID=265543 /ORGANISM="Minutocellus polymorphus, Strain RCC2270" /LENGTH=226 /DNA_ID=CAMNT_0028501673 /DNA_START=1 /DNA_END=678 /DNA_ORIENTATION=-
MAESDPDTSWAKEGGNDEENAALTSSGAGEGGPASGSGIGSAGTADSSGTNTSSSWSADPQVSTSNPSSKRSSTHRFFRFVKFLAVVSSFMLFVGQCVAIFYGRASHVQVVLKLYVMAFCVLIIMNEMEWTRLATESKLLVNWMGRGFSYSFVGLVSVEENDVMVRFINVSLAGKTQLMFIEAVSYMMVGVGVIYFILGLSCCKSVSDRARLDYTKRRYGETAPTL